MTDKIQYKQFNGNVKNKMPALLKAGYRPANMSDVAALRVQGDLRDTYIDTVTGIPQSTSGSIKVVQDSDLIKKIGSSTRIVNHGLLLGDGVYNSINAQEFTKEEVKKYANNYLSKEEAMNNPLWAAMVPDKALREEYVELVFDKNDGKNMGVFVNTSVNSDIIRAVCAGRLEFRSNAVARYSLGNSADRFVGISVGDAKEKGLEGKFNENIWNAVESGLAFQHNGILYVPTNAENLNLKE